jgi:hypothetical protein
MNKVGFLDGRLLKSFYKVFSGVAATISFILLFCDIPKQHKIVTLTCTLILLLIYYIGTWRKAKNQTSITLKFGESYVDVKFGDIFKSDKDDLKVISFNEYFDTEVGKLVSPRTINGKFLEMNKNRISEIQSIIAKDEHLNQEMYVSTNEKREQGNKKRYQLGSLVDLSNNYLAVAGSKFDSEDKANVTMREYIGFLLTFWNEVNRMYNNQSVVIPVFGSGILRFADGYAGATGQDLLEIIIWTFKISRIKIAYPSRVKIVVFQNKSDMYNLYKLKEIEKDGL